MSKYSAKKTECGAGHVHDSKMEARRCDELRLMERAGAIEELEYQPEFPVVINGKAVCKYTADFAWKVSGVRVVEDVKGMATAVFNLKKRLVEASYPGVVITLYPPRQRKPRKKAA